MTKTPQDCCPQCGGKATKTVDAYRTDTNEPVYKYRSTAANIKPANPGKYLSHRTAAEQLVEQEKETELYVARTTFLEKQLVDKERELRQIITTDQLMATLFAYNDALDKLTAANAVVEDIRTGHQCSGRGCFVCTVLHKLQGGS